MINTPTVAEYIAEKDRQQRELMVRLAFAHRAELEREKAQEKPKP